MVKLRKVLSKLLDQYKEVEDLVRQANEPYSRRMLEFKLAGISIAIEIVRQEIEAGLKEK